MSNKVNIAIQVLPITQPEKVLNVIDQAIEVIINSGIKYEVCPFETVMEGSYDEIMDIVQIIRDTCLKSGTEELLINLKMQIHRDRDVSMETKTAKFEH